MTIQYVMITGNIVDGIAVYGPFVDCNDAVDYAEDFKIDEYVMAQLNEPRQSWRNQKENPG